MTRTHGARGAGLAQPPAPRANPSFGIDPDLRLPGTPGSSLGPGRMGQGHGRVRRSSGGFPRSLRLRPRGLAGPGPRQLWCWPGRRDSRPGASSFASAAARGRRAPAVPGPSGLGGAGGWRDSPSLGWTAAAAAMPGTGSRVVARSLQCHAPHTDPVFSSLILLLNSRSL